MPDLKPEQHPDVDSMIEAMRQKDLGLLCSVWKVAGDRYDSGLSGDQ